MNIMKKIFPDLRVKKNFFKALSTGAGKSGFEVEKGYQVLYLSKEDHTFMINLSSDCRDGANSFSLEISLEQPANCAASLEKAAENLMEMGLLELAMSRLLNLGQVKIEDKQQAVSLAQQVLERLEHFCQEREALIQSGAWQKRKIIITGLIRKGIAPGLKT